MIIKSFTYPEIDDTTRNYAGVFPVINPSGDWTDFLTPFESQSQNNVEPSSCFIEAQQSCIAILLEYVFGIKDSNFSSRFNALLSDGTEQGGDPIKGAKSFKKDGLISQELMDWKGVENWQDFHSWTGVDKNKCIEAGKNFLREYDLTYKIIVERDIPLKTKYVLLKEALKTSPVAISVYAWVERDGKYYKPEGMRDTHLTTAIVLKVTDNNEIIVKDTYEPFIKTLEKDTDFEFAIGWSVKKKDPLAIHKSYLEILKGVVKLLYEYIAFVKKTAGEIAVGLLSKRD
jgi:hypothetical protein